MSFIARVYAGLSWLRREVLSQFSGKVAIALLVAIVAVSIYAAATMPSNYNVIWNYPLYWEANPKNSPPEWSTYFGTTCLTNQVYDLRTATPRISVDEEGRVRLTYNMTYTLDVKSYPRALILIVDSMTIPANVRNVRVLNTIVKPDGKQIQVFDDLVDFTKNVTAGSFKFTQTFRPELDKIYNSLLLNYINYNIDPNDVGVNYLSYIFGEITQPDPKSTARTTYLTGRYVISLTLDFRVEGVAQELLLRSIKNAARFEYVVVGTCYGLMGTDYQGRDLAMGLLYGFPIALLIGLGTALMSTGLGLLAGMVSGYYGGFIDEFIQRFIDVLGSIPLLPILILVAAAAQTAFGADPNKPVLMLLTILGVLVLFGWGGLAIVVRSMTLSIKSELYVEAAKSIGASNFRILIKHILPQLVPYIAASLVYSTPNAILTEAGLSVLGIYHGLPTWGGILAEARTQGRVEYWWWIFPPGLLIAITSLTFVLLGLALEKVVEPRLRR
ncbi:MAG: hypothetical protein B7O98_07115 [Zestosphaera tikiterensis]|uniref:ABC transmembrane type-1 domain-containing protein n=1 Tax=Zestosphaera tikiterensis TaxID=1973259 RepID=A0A2R7Y4X5_9CREN|nr:MAG: hypothetical protein B7O98_07115 [Zestosphaera tikiterensis]